MATSLENRRIYVKKRQELLPFREHLIALLIFLVCGVSLYCPFFIALSFFFNVYLCRCNKSLFTLFIHLNISIFICSIMSCIHSIGDRLFERTIVKSQKILLKIVYQKNSTPFKVFNNLHFVCEYNK